MFEFEGSHVRIDLIKSLSVLDDDDSHVEDELNCLQDVYQMAHDLSIGSECNVAKGFHGILVGIKLQEHLPDLPPCVAR